MTLEVKEFDFIRSFLQEKSAILLDDEKHYLVESRLQPLARREGFASVSELLQKLQFSRVHGLPQKVVEAMTTHETSFFRDVRPFDALRKFVLPERIAAQSSTRQLNIWCMACSTGQEPFTLAMMIRESFPQLQSWDIHITATDLSTQILEKARQGLFSQLDVSRGLPTSYFLKYFQKDGVNWLLREDIRKMIDFRTMNLIQPWPASPPADLILLRNVLIYFDVNSKKEILSKVRRLMHPDGYLLLGGAESTLNLDYAFKRVELEKSSFYRLH